MATVTISRVWKRGDKEPGFEGRCWSKASNLDLAPIEVQTREFACGMRTVGWGVESVTQPGELVVSNPLGDWYDVKLYRVEAPDENDDEVS